MAPTSHGRLDDLVVGFDLGTSAIKVGIYTLDGACIGLVSAPVELRHLGGGHTEQDATDFYRIAAELCRRCVADHDVPPESVVAVAFAGQMAGVGLVDDDHQPVAAFDSWLDNRCGEIVAELEPVAERVIVSAGCAPTVSIGPKMLWWQRHHPQLCDSAAAFVTAVGFVAANATGRRGSEAFIDPTHLHFTSVADVAESRWDDELVSMLGVDERLLPAIVESTDIIGTLTRSAAADFGLAEGTPVAAGCGDAAATALGAGALEPGVALDIAGTAAVFAVSTDSFVADVKSRTLLTMRAPLSGRWCSLAYIGGGGQVVEWVCRELLGVAELDADAYRALEDAVSAAPPGSDGLFVSPHFDGRVSPPLPAMRGAYIGLSLAHGRPHLARAALESVAYEYRTYLELIRELSPGWQLHRVIGAGGGTGSTTWNQIKADVLGADYAPLSKIDPGTRGAALLAIAALGHELPAPPTPRLDETVTPNVDAHRRYGELHRSYVRWSSHLANAYATNETDSIPPNTGEEGPPS